MEAGQVICFGHWNANRYDTIRPSKSACIMGFAFLIFCYLHYKNTFWLPVNPKKRKSMWGVDGPPLQPP